MYTLPQARKKRLACYIERLRTLTITTSSEKTSTLMMVYAHSFWTYVDPSKLQGRSSFPCHPWSGYFNSRHGKNKVIRRRSSVHAEICKGKLTLTTLLRDFPFHFVASKFCSTFVTITWERWAPRKKNETKKTVWIVSRSTSLPTSNPRFSMSEKVERKIVQQNC